MVKKIGTLFPASRVSNLLLTALIFCLNFSPIFYTPITIMPNFGIQRMKILTVLLFSLVFCTSMLFSAEKKNVASPVVLELGAHNKITLAEFKDFFQRYNGGTVETTQVEKKDIERFIDLFTKYELKLADAFSRKYNEKEETQAETKEYRTELAKSYLVDKVITESAVKKMYERRKEEIRARHILFRFPEIPEANDEDEGEETAPEDITAIDTNAIRQKALDAIQRLNNGEKFEDVAKELTEDEAGKSNGGDLYYFTTGQMVAQFEDAAYNLKKGAYTKEPVLSPFGFHVIQVTDRKPAVGNIRISHIMARFNANTPTPEDTLQAFKKITALMDSVKKKGANFSAIAKRNSDDAGSASKGGDIGTFTRRRWVQAFDEAAFKLKPNELSPIVRTPYGYHIMKCTEVQPLASYDKMKEELKSTYQSSRLNDERALYILSLQKKYNAVENKDVLHTLIASLDTAKVIGDSAWTASVADSIKQLTLYAFNGSNISVDSLLKAVEAMQENFGSPVTSDEFSAALDRVYENFILTEESKNIEQRFPEFATMMTEFEKGILLYRIEQDEVWSKVNVTDSALDAYFETHREKFRFPNRVNVQAIYVGTDSLINAIHERLQKGESFDTLAYTENASIIMRLKRGKLDWMPAEQDTMTRIAWKLDKGQYSKPFLYEGNGYTVVQLLEKEESRLKTADEAGTEISNAYQDAESKMFETKWLERVKQEFPVKVNRDVITKAFAKVKKK